MSDFRAIGGVSATLRALLVDRMEFPDGVTSVPVTIGPPIFGAKQDGEQQPELSRVNLFLYRVTENGFLQNQEIPGRGPANGFGHPPLSLNLHYLLSAYGNDQVLGYDSPQLFDDTTAHFLLGSAMRVLHDVPIVTERITTMRPPSGTTILHESLRDAYEQVKLTLEPLTLEDITKVWTALTLRFRLSACYVVNVVQLESRRTPRFVRPVGQPAAWGAPPLPSDPPSPGPMVRVVTLHTPTITEVRVRRRGQTTEQPVPYAAVGDTLVLRGTSLAGPTTTVAFGDVRVPASVAGNERVEAVIPDDTIPGLGPIPTEQRLQPGPRAVRVVAGDPRSPSSSFSSNDAVFMLVPRVDVANLSYAPGPPRTLTIPGSRLLSGAAGGETLIGRAVVPRSTYRGASATELVVPIPDTLPARDVPVFISAALSDPVAISQTLAITIGGPGGATRSATWNGESPVAPDRAAEILAAMIHDAKDATSAAPFDHRFAGARVNLWNNQLVILPGGLTDPISFASPAGSSLAGDLGLTATQRPEFGSAFISGELESPPPLSSPNPRLTMQVGTQSVKVSFTKSTSLAGLAANLQAAINGASAAAEYAGAQVMTSGARLLIIPGAAAAVGFGSAPGDDTTVTELQLHANFAVRVRANGAESIDDAVVELPR
ncbi:MAG TPA: DUF4255 domain-containing protein [Thermomicrobiales bacterium]|nr:DUF4255 domain-containing protein [Thermomicrobiales bacterium]